MTSTTQFVLYCVFAAIFIALASVSGYRKGQGDGADLLRRDNDMLKERVQKQRKQLNAYRDQNFDLTLRVAFLETLLKMAGVDTVVPDTELSEVEEHSA